MTNYEKMKNMTIEEMVRYIAGSACPYCIYDGKRCEDCNDGVRQWLEQESE